MSLGKGDFASFSIHIHYSLAYLRFLRKVTAILKVYIIQPLMTMHPHMIMFKKKKECPQYQRHNACNDIVKIFVLVMDQIMQISPINK